MLTKQQKLIRARAALTFVQTVGRKPTPAELERQIQQAAQGTIRGASWRRFPGTKPAKSLLVPTQIR